MVVDVQQEKVLVEVCFVASKQETVSPQVKTKQTSSTILTNGLPQASGMLPARAHNTPQPKGGKPARSKWSTNTNRPTDSA